MAFQVGSPAPDFKQGAWKPGASAPEEIKLSDYKGKWVVLAFYPLDFTLV